MMNKIEVRGKLVLSNDHHKVELEPASLTGGGTAFFYLKTQDHCVPIYKTRIPEVIAMLRSAQAFLEEIDSLEKGEPV